MHRTKAGTMGRAGMLAAIAALVAVVGVLPMFGRPGPAYAAGLNLDYTSAYSQFIIPGVFGARLDAKFPPPETHELLKDANCALAMPDVPIASVPNPKGEDRPENGTADMWVCAPTEPAAPFNRLDFDTGAAESNLRIGGVVALCAEPPGLTALGQWKKTIEGVETWGVDFVAPCINQPTGESLTVWLLEYTEANCTLEKQDVNAPGKPATPPPDPGEYDQWKCAPKITNPYAQDATFSTESAQIEVADAQNVVFECPATGEVVNVPDAKVPGVWQGNFQAACKGGFDVYVKPSDPHPDIVNAYALFPSSNAPVNNGLLTMINHIPGPYVMSLNSPVAGIFPATGELLLGKTELVVYNTTSPCGLTPLGPNDVCVTTRAKVGEIKQHEPGTKVKLATQLTSPISTDASNVAQTTLAAAISATAGGCTAIGPPPEQNQAKCPDGGSGITPFKITVASRANFPASGFITISHQEAQTANLMGSGNATEYMEYDLTSCGALGANQLCIIARSQQSNNQAHSHDADGFAQPGHQPGRSMVTLHFQIEVKSNAGFFPADMLVVYNVDDSNNIVDAELMNYNNAAPKVKTPSSTQFHVVDRGAPASTFDKTAIVTHKQYSIVTGSDSYLACLNGNEQPGVDTDLITPGYQEPVAQVPGTSVGIVAVCYTQDQPNTPPATFEPKEARQLHVPIIGSDLLVMASIPGQPFLSTGGFDHVILGPVPHVDVNGTQDNVLNLISPCILDYTPGTNLQVTISLTTDKNWATTDQGTIKVVLDTVHDANTGGDPADDCDDPAGTDLITNTTYYWDTDPNATDNDTDGDGCSDVEELNADYMKGGVRDPWNPYDYFDVNGDSYIDLFNDILGVISAYSAGGGIYDAAKDRGAVNYGPFGWNRSQPDGTIDLFNDILGVIGQYQHDCRPPP